MVLWDRHVFWEMVDTFTMELNDFPWTRPDALAAVRAALVNDTDLRFEEFDGILRAHTNTATAEITFPGNKVNHQWRRAGQAYLVE
jgi:hypothetical protein